MKCRELRVGLSFYSRKFTMYKMKRSVKFIKILVIEQSQ